MKAGGKQEEDTQPDTVMFLLTTAVCKDKPMKSMKFTTPKRFCGGLEPPRYTRTPVHDEVTLSTSLLCRWGDHLWGGRVESLLALPCSHGIKDGPT